MPKAIVGLEREQAAEGDVRWAWRSRRTRLSKALRRVGGGVVVIWQYVVERLIHTRPRYERKSQGLAWVQVPNLDFKPAGLSTCTGKGEMALSVVASYCARWTWIECGRAAEETAFDRQTPW